MSAKKLKRFFLCTLSPMLLALCIGFNAQVLTEEVRIPQRIVSLSPSVSESIYLLGAEDSLVGRTEYCIRPEPILKKEVVGGVVDVNVEKIASLKPDWVITSAMISLRDKQMMEKLGLRIKEIKTARNYEEMCTQFIELGVLLGKEKEANTLVLQSKASVEAIRTQSQALPKINVFFHLSQNPLITVTRESFINDIIEFAGGQNIARDAASARISREAVLKTDPDVIMIATMGQAGDKDKDVWMQYDFLKAVRQHHVYRVDPYAFCSPTVKSFPNAVQELARIIHAEDPK